MSIRGRRVVIAMAVAFGVVVIGLVVASAALNSYLHHHERQFLGQLEERLGRKVEVHSFSASLFTGVRAEQITISGSSEAGDQAPLLTVERVRVRPSIVRTLWTLGRHIQIADVRLVGPKVNVVRFADGSLNVDRVAAQWQRTAQTAQAPMAERTRHLIENARIRHAGIADGRIHFVDRMAGDRAVDVTAIELALADVGMKRHPAIELRAALMAAQPNLHLQARLGAAGTLEQLPPPVESVRIKLARTELGPIAPLLARVTSGLEAGVATVDLEAQSVGPPHLRGTAQLAQARFTGGAPFDATLDIDLGGDPRTGDVDVRRLDLSVSHMSLVAHGRLLSLSKQPRFEAFAVESRDLDFDQMRRIYPALDRALGAELHGPAKLGATATALTWNAFVDLSAASISAPGRFDKPRGATWRIDANGRAQKNAVEIESLTMKIAQESLRAHGAVRVGEQHPQIDLYATTDRLSIAALSPLIPALARAGLPPIVVSMNAHLTGRAGVPESMALDVDRLAIASRKTNLAGSVKLRNFARPQFDLRAQSSYLDTADLLPAPTATAPRGAAPKASGPSAMARVSGHAVVDVTRGSLSGIPFETLRVDLAMRDGAVHANQLQVGAWGGRVAADGSDFDVARGPFHLLGHADRVDVEQMLTRLGSARKILSGRLTAQLDVHGRGTTTAELERSLAGTLDGTVDQAQLLAFDFDELLVAQLVRALPFRLPTQRLATGTSLGTLHGQLRFGGGAIALSRPLVATTPEGPIELTGRVFFDGRLDLNGTLELKPATASALFANRIRLNEPLPLSLRLGGDFSRPSLSISNLGDAAKVLVGGAVGALIPGRQQAKIPSGKQLENEAVDQLKGLLRP